MLFSSFDLIQGCGKFSVLLHALFYSSHSSLLLPHSLLDVNFLCSSLFSFVADEITFMHHCILQTNFCLFSFPELKQCIHHPAAYINWGPILCQRTSLGAGLGPLFLLLKCHCSTNAVLSARSCPRIVQGSKVPSYLLSNMGPTETA